MASSHEARFEINLSVVQKFVEESTVFLWLVDHEAKVPASGINRTPQEGLGRLCMDTNSNIYKTSITHRFRQGMSDGKPWVRAVWICD
jgi:hypothetical protein